MRFIPFSFIALLLAVAVQAQQNQDHLNYIEKYHQIAIQEMERAGVPASIKLAQGILESDAGRSYLAKRANNHFGIKCGSNWEGKKVYRKDDDYDDKGKLIESCFRSYRTVEASYVAHSEFLRDPRKTFRYGFLFQLDPQDYRRWANGLKKAGYATSATYPQKLIGIIERYELFKYDDVSTISIENPEEIVTSDILRNNDVKYTITAANETVEELARRTDVAVNNLIKYNEHLRSGNQTLDENTRVYLQSKRSSYRGRQTYHTVEAGQTMFDISQRYGIRLDKLYSRNRMVPGTQAAPGERVKIRGGKLKSPPRLRSKEEEAPKPTVLPPTKPPVDTDADDELLFEDETEEETAPVIDRPSTTHPAPTPSQPNRDVPVIIVDRNNGNTTTIYPSKPGNSDATETPPTGNRPGTGTPTIEDEQPTLDEDIFGDDTTPTVPTPRPPVPSATTDQHYVVQKGDTLYGIARRFNTDVATLKRINNLANNNLRIGQDLRVK